MKDRPSVAPFRSRSRRVGHGRPSPAAPAWPALVVILLVGIGLFALTDILTPEGAVRTIADSLMVVLMFGAMAAWVRANGPALERINEHAREGFPPDIRYVALDRHLLWRAKTTGRRPEFVRLNGAKQP